MHYREQGHLGGFTVDYRSHGFSVTAKRLHNNAISRVKAAIREGPVVFVGGGGSGIFRYDPGTRCVERSPDLSH